MSTRLPLLNDLPTAEPVSAEPKAQWRSIEDRNHDPSLLAISERENPQAALRAQLGDVTRRGFLGGATLSAAIGLSGCFLRKPKQTIVPLAQRPEDMIPGQPIFYATAAQSGSQVVSLLITSQDGRPIKVDGHSGHASSGGGSSAWLQASVYDLYNSDRSRDPLKDGAKSDWDAYRSWAKGHFDGARGKGGVGTALLLRHRPSPTTQRLVASFRASFPKGQVFVADAALRGNSAAGAALVGMAGKEVHSSLAGADIILAVDSDFLGTDNDTVRLSREFADARRVRGPGGTMSRLYAVEPNFSMTGAMADNRKRMSAHEVGAFLQAVAKDVLAGAALPAASAVGRSLKAGAHAKWAAAVAKDLLAHKGKSLVLVGERQPAWVHALALTVNQALGNLGKTVTLVDAAGITGAGGHPELVKAIAAGGVDTLVVLGGNPAFEATGDLQMAAALGKVGTLIHHGTELDETAALANWHLPASHYLESWGDLTAADGSTLLQQPLVAPLYGTLSENELLALIVGDAITDGHELVRATWSEARGSGPSFEKNWRKWLHDGQIEAAAPVPAAITTNDDTSSGGEDAPEVASPQAPAAPVWSYAALASALGAVSASAAGFELNFVIDPSIFDGRYANNPWLQELPDPMSKLAWDNAALLGATTARELDVQLGDLVEISAAGETLSMAAMVVPGIADKAVILPIGYGRRKSGAYGSEAGFDVSPLRSAANPWFVAGATVKKVSGSYDLTCSQNHHRMEPRKGWEPRPLIREATFADYQADPEYTAKAEVMEEERLKSLWVHPNPSDPQQWGMSIDLTVCTGCNACTVACQAENNISVVGKERCLDGREMSWIRMDRYFTGEEDDPQAVFQPIGCAHCESAPCEGVCPVAATSHSPEGLNDIAYNRCIGTRYCANNCPFKVRRYNFFHYSQEEDETNPNIMLNRNPNVTVRFRGVIEKCTFCVQRINAAKIAVKRVGVGRVPDGTIVPACGQACPTGAIVFGDQSDPDSMVSKLKALGHDYGLLAELNLHTRTTFLGKLRNPNPELA